MGPSGSLRYLAPLALVAFTIIVIVIVSGSGGSPNASTAVTATKPTRHRHVRHSYVVHTGDSLSRISVRTGVPMTRIEALNPKLAPDGLAPGQRIKLAP